MRGSKRHTPPGHDMHGDAGRITLDRLRPGETATVVDVGDERVRVQAIRLGLGEGADIRVVTRIPTGPVVVVVGRQEIAVGRKLARRIVVDRAAGPVHAQGRGGPRGRRRGGPRHGRGMGGHGSL